MSAIQTINWEDWANYLAMDEDGLWWQYRDEPILGVVGWRSSELSELYESSDLPLIDTSEWEKTLIKRRDNECNS